MLGSGNVGELASGNVGERCLHERCSGGHDIAARRTAARNIDSATRCTADGISAGRFHRRPAVAAAGAAAAGTGASARVAATGGGSSGRARGRSQGLPWRARLLVLLPLLLAVAGQRFHGGYSHLCAEAAQQELGSSWPLAHVKAAPQVGKTCRGQAPAQAPYILVPPPPYLPQR